MELLQNPAGTDDVGATSRLMTTSTQEPQHRGQVDEEAQEQNEDREEEEEGREEEGRGKNEANERQKKSQNIWSRACQRLRDKCKIKPPKKFTPEP